MRVDSRRCLDMMTSSVGFIAPSSIQRFWISIILYTLATSTTQTVAETVWTTTGPRPRFARSRLMIRSFRIGVLKESASITATSESTTAKSKCCIVCCLIGGGRCDRELSLPSANTKKESSRSLNS